MSTTYVRQAASRGSFPSSPSKIAAEALSAAAILVPHVAHGALPAVLRLRELVVLFACGLIARVPLLHEFVQFAHRLAAGACPERSVFDRLRPNGSRRAFQFARNGFVCHRV